MNVQFVEDHRDYIINEMRRRTYRRPFYSQRAMARDLGLAPSTLTDYLKDRIGLSEGRLSQLAKTLGLSQEQKQHWQDLILFKFSRNEENKRISQIRIKSRIDSEKNSLTIDQFKTIAQWQHLAVLELIEMNAKKYSQVSQAAQVLNIKASEAKEIFNRLEDQGLLKKDNAEKVYRVSNSTNVSNSTSSEAIRQFHTDILKKALSAVEQQSVDERFVSSTVIGLNSAQINLVKEALAHLPFKLFEPVTATNNHIEKDQLYCFSFQFFNLLENSQRTKS